ncbi:hydantoinase/oxoprolinase family protein [Enhydrobacter sp.]|jgi:N-methylhydantoinase A|uniref:hydantoinase/oxoprolinase family protein n=1 Tax=Enhydrobacter sp. TaxID=1894999 RepID=UPI0026018617|nr:hydantoinase/oxoprolinase family protein [Enhydrobacter sp.]WIM10702.1 MAG: N-methylhydantoinase A [Enhydrobacter sp.]
MSSSKNSLTVGIDVGGTFTDLLAVDSDSGTVRLAKVLTTADNQAVGFMAALQEADADPARLQAVVHGTTTTTNALLERKIARVGLITTKGFRDVLELGRRTRPQPYGLKGTFHPVVERELRLEVSERMDADGHVLIPLDEAAVTDAAKKLLAAGCEAVVVHFLHSYINPAHERRAAEIVRGLWPNAYVTAGHAILSEYREFERGVTAAVNAAVQPVLDRYLSRLRAELAAKDFDRDILVMQGNGGTISSQLIARAAVNTVMSGPASGVMAAAYTGRLCGQGNLITYDMGGTSTDVGLIEDAVPQVSGELELEYAMPIHVPMVDVHTIGAGGGSIASVDAGGMLRVGPESAGARPGPICYGRGGDAPTITDANLLLGRLNPDHLLGVDHPVTLDHVRQAIEGKLGKRLGLDAEAAAAAILRIANDRMAGAIRLVSLSRGHDPRDFALFAFGGAGPLHASALARELAIPTVLVPARPGITNALGCVVADLRHDFVRTVNKPLSTIDDATIASIYAEQKQEGEATVAREGVPVGELRAIHSADMQFQGQSHILSVAVERPDLGIDGLHKAFAAAYWRRFGIELSEIPPVLVNLHTAVIGVRPHIDLGLLAASERASTLQAAQIGERRAWFSDGWRQTPIYARDKLPIDAIFEGPAILEQLDCTTVVEPGDKVRQDRLGNLLITVR